MRAGKDYSSCRLAVIRMAGLTLHARTHRVVNVPQRFKVGMNPDICATFLAAHGLEILPRASAAQLDGGHAGPLTYHQLGLRSENKRRRLPRILGSE